MTLVKARNIVPATPQPALKSSADAPVPLDVLLTTNAVDVGGSALAHHSWFINTSRIFENNTRVRTRLKNVLDEAFGILSSGQDVCVVALPRTARRSSSASPASESSAYTGFMPLAARQDDRPQVVEVIARIEGLLTTWRTSGRIVESPIIEESVVNGDHYIDVRLMTTADVFTNREQRHAIFDALEAFGDAHIHVQPHLSRRRAHQEG